MVDFILYVRDGLAALRRRDPEGTRTFGASTHRYELNEPIAEKRIKAFERKHRITLPADYRSFVAELGNGGAGPAYGVFKVGEVDDGFGFKRIRSGHFIGSLAQPFPHREAWNLPEAELERIQAIEDDSEILRLYWKLMNGAMPICHEGCAIRDWLVVTGPEAGTVWLDATADFSGWTPRTHPDGRHMTFGEWYASWLDKALRAVAPS